VLKVRLTYLVKVNFLLLALVGVVFLMSKLRSNGLGQGVAAIFGLPSPGKVIKVAPGSVTTTLDWCDTRVSAIERTGSPTLRQVKLKWMWESTPPLELNFIAVEKWFGRHCRVKVERLGPGQFNEASAQPAMLVHFIKGPAETLYRMGSNVFKWRQEIFRSDELDGALKDLELLPDQGSRTSR